MQDARELHHRAGAMAAGVIARIPAERLRDPTPCTEWDVRGVINHMATVLVGMRAIELTLHTTSTGGPATRRTA